MASMKSAPKIKKLNGEPIPKWDMSRLKKRACIVCQSEANNVIGVRPDGLAIVRCASCNALYLPLVPDEEQLTNFYSAYSNFKPYLNKSVVDPALLSLKQKVKKYLAGTSAWKVIKKARGSQKVTHISPECEILMRTGGVMNKVILELGPGKDAGLLPEIKYWGGGGVAVEIDSVAAEQMRTHGIEVYRQICDVPKGVDIIYASMVLEHLVNPLKTLSQLASTLVPEGRILIKVPNAGQAKTQGNNWIGFRVDLEHLNYFDENSLSYILERAGFQMECVWLTSQPVLSQYLGMANRQHFLLEAKRYRGGKVALSTDDPMQDGAFTLNVLARI